MASIINFLNNTLLSYSLCTPILHKIPFVKQRDIF
ncbi:hypothetical protein NEOC65_001043 [Neochlamydia sp. AcF65]|nr:hypothetical protein [Neochlamydia sp. AcF65]MBS4169830.1 hypothetical protein [Neochlamydia sp. AcF95]